MKLTGAQTIALVLAVGGPIALTLWMAFLGNIRPSGNDHDRGESMRDTAGSFGHYGDHGGHDGGADGHH